MFREHAGSAPTLGFDEFKNMYRDISGRQEDEFLNIYVESIFRSGNILQGETLHKYSCQGI